MPIVQTGPHENQNIEKSIFDRTIKGDPSLPRYYNFRSSHPECQSTILDQGECGSCWAFSTAGMLGDRICKKSGGKFDITLSPQDMLNCAWENMGCEGGYLVPAIDFLMSDGATSN